VTGFTPSGEQVEITLGDQRAVIVEVGAGLRSYSAEGRELLDGYSESEQCVGGRGHPLLPWPNRIRDGKYEWEGEAHQLDITEPALNNAIHGLTRWRNWHVAQRETSRVVMEHLLYPGPGYPFALDLQITYELSTDGLLVTTKATNAGRQTAPYGVGFHPYLRRPDGSIIDDAILTVPAAIEIIADDRLIPISRESVANGDGDFSTPKAIGGTVIDTCFTDLARDPDDRARFSFAEPDGSHTTTIWLDETYLYAMVFTGDTLAPVQRRRGIAIEPMTCAPNAFQTGQDVIRLEPGENHISRWGVGTA
jgi:aldose 1-epimerase